MQIDHDNETLRHFARFARLFASLFSYRKSLFQEAHDTGAPIVRAMGLMFPSDKECRTLDTQFMLGADVIMVPVLKRSSKKVFAYIPQGAWIHIWSSHSYEQGWSTISAPIGYPCILVRKNSTAGTLMQEFLKEEKNEWPL